MKIDVLKSPTFWAKILELVLSSLCIALFVSDSSQVQATKPEWSVLLGTFVGFIMINIIIIMGSVMENPLSRILILIITLPAAFLFFTSGGILMKMWSGVKGELAGHHLGSAILAFANGIVYLGDFALTFFKFGEV